MDILTTLHGLFLGTLLAGAIVGSAILLVILAYRGAWPILGSLSVGVMLVGFGAPPPALYAFVAVAILFHAVPLRRVILTALIMRSMKRRAPRISDTERVALEAGVLWIEKDLFSGRPDFKKLQHEPYPQLTQEEREFLDGPVERLCAVLDDWQMWKARELPPAAWEIIRQEKLFGMIIPKEYGGLSLSALANSQVVMKLASRSMAGAVTVMVPNSLGPAELLIQYGTEEQKKRFLPRLATAAEIPCFALTEPTAGSDAASVQASGTLFKGEDGQLCIRLNWNKRFITLAPVATLLGLAFRLYDPDQLLGKGADVGITLALIPASAKGVSIGRHHDPLGVPFPNGPTQGHDVVVPAEAIIGGVEGAGKGWMMLMESLAAGRGISLPALSVGGAKLTARVVSAYAAVRRQFGIPIGRFEGIEEPLARIAGLTYLMEAARKLTCGALDKGIKPPVVTAIAKYHQTELMRQVVNDGMDIMGGTGIMRGPRNLLAHLYIGAPVNITVEGANIMTRTLIIFGQGSLRAHPYAYAEIKALETNNLAAFDRAFWAHVGHAGRNSVRALLLSLTRGYLSPSPRGGPVGRYYRRLAWTSAAFAVLTDIAMVSLGGELKRREKLTGRFADVLSWMYLGFATLRRYDAEGRREEDLPLVHYAMAYALGQVQGAFEGILANLHIPGLSWFLKGPVRLWFRGNPLADPIPDQLSLRVAQLMQSPSAQRDRFTDGIYRPAHDDDHLHRLDAALQALEGTEEAERKIRAAVRDGRLPRGQVAALLDQALANGVITPGELEQLKLSETLRMDAITVSDFAPEEYLERLLGQPAARSG